MKAHIRHVAAYIAHRLISDVSGSAIYDYAEGRYVKYGGSVSVREVMVFDLDRFCYISGKPTGGKFSLFDFGESSIFTLEVAGDAFRGFDYCTLRHFSGSVQGRCIRLFDFDDNWNHTYGF